MLRPGCLPFSFEHDNCLWKWGAATRNGRRCAVNIVRKNTNVTSVTTRPRAAEAVRERKSKWW